jgi:hypothetical protein
MHIVKTITKKHSLIVRLLALALALACTVPLLSQTVFAKNTYVITDGDQVTVHTTYETNPEIVLDEAGLQLSDVDVYETQAKDGVSEITVRRGMTVTVYSGGEVMQIISYGETVQEMVDRMGIPLVEESIVSVPMDTMTYDGMEILIQTTLTSTDSYTVVIPFETEYQQTGLLDKGVEVILTAGVDGQKPRSFTRDEVTEIITARVDEIAEEIQAAIDDSGIKLGNWSNIYLTGGGLSFNRGGKDYLSNKLGRPVRDVPKRTTKMNSHAYSSTLGLMDLIIDTIEQQHQPSAGFGGAVKDFFRSLLGG